MSPQFSCREAGVRRASGFTLVELSVVLVILGALIAVSATLVPNLIGNTRANANTARLEQMKDALIGYILANNRLPCPDSNTTPDGIENPAGGSNATNPCTASVGSLPFVNLGLDSGQDVHRFNVLYAPFIDAGNTTSSLTFNPSVFNPPRGLDYFCQSLQNNIRTTNAAATANATRIQRYNTTGAANQISQAFVIASAGYEDADANGNKFDGLNANATVAGAGFLLFEDPSRPRTARSTDAGALNNDDQVVSLSFADLASRLKCGEISALSNLRIVNDTIPNGAASVVIVADGGVPYTAGGTYRWCYEILSGGTGVAIPNAYNATGAGSNCTASLNSAWFQNNNVTITANATGIASNSILLYVRDNNQPGNTLNVTASRDNVAWRTFTFFE